jgi:hypothetical protein
LCPTGQLEVFNQIMKNKKGFIKLPVLTAIIVIFALGAVGYFGYVLSQNKFVVSTAPPPHIPQIPSNQPAQTKTYVWKLSDAPDGPYNPRTTVELIVGDKTYAVGTYDGTCGPIGSSQVMKNPGFKNSSDFSNGTFIEGEVSAVECYFAGGGDEVGVFNESGGPVVRHGDIGEATVDSPWFRGNFKVLFEVK